MLQVCPYDPGPKGPHGLKSYRFWDNLDEARLISKKRESDQAVVLPITKLVASVYLLLQIFLHYFLGFVKRFAITIKIYHQLPASDVEKGEEMWGGVAPATGHYVDSVDVDKSKLSGIQIDPVHVKEKTHFFPYFHNVPLNSMADAHVATTFSTAVFEVANGGLQHLLKDIQQEMRKHYEVSHDLVNGHGTVIACCDTVWSVPSKFRSYWTETALNNELGQMMRVNSQCVYDLICSKYSGLRRVGFGGTVRQAECDQEGRGVRSGFHRHFYPELMQLAHKRAAEEHGNVWNFDPKSTEINLDWSSIGNLEETTVVAVNFVLLKF